MKGIALGLSLLLIAATTKSSAAQDAVAIETAGHTAACGESFGCLDAGAAGIAGIRLFQGNDIAAVVRHLNA